MNDNDQLRYRNLNHLPGGGGGGEESSGGGEESSGGGEESSEMVLGRGPESSFAYKQLPPV